jgi:D-sedoheptulose 7-phosphate isomerase
VSEPTGFLYPFLDATPADPAALLADLAESARAKAAQSAELARRTLAECAGLIEEAAGELARRFADGGRMYTFGNGGSSTDAATLADLFARPPHGRAVPAWSLAADEAVLTALGNDIGFDVVFSRQLIAHAGPHDVAVAMSASGGSADLLAGLAEAKRRGLLTVGFAGYDGGRFAEPGVVDFCVVVRSQSIHRIQEAQAQVGYQLWAAVQSRLDSAARDRLRAAGEHR